MFLRRSNLSLVSIPADLWMIVVVLLWGFNFVIMKNALNEIPPALFVTLRFTAGSVMMITILRIQHGHIALPKRDYLQLILLGIIGNAAYQSMFIWGLKYTSAANGSLIINATPIVVGLFGHAQAIVKLDVGGELMHTAAEGNGPVNALDLALRKALLPSYPQLAEFQLADYKVRILNSESGTAAITRVLIDTQLGSSRWSTVGASTNIIQASWLALLDSIEYGLCLAPIVGPIATVNESN